MKLQYKAVKHLANLIRKPDDTSWRYKLKPTEEVRTRSLCISGTTLAFTSARQKKKKENKPKRKRNKKCHHGDAWGNITLKKTKQTILSAKNLANVSIVSNGWQLLSQIAGFIARSSEGKKYIFLRWTFYSVLLKCFISLNSSDCHPDRSDHPTTVVIHPERTDHPTNVIHPALSPQVGLMKHDLENTARKNFNYKKGASG